MRWLSQSVQQQRVSRCPSSVQVPVCVFDGAHRAATVSIALRLVPQFGTPPHCMPLTLTWVEEVQSASQYNVAETEQYGSQPQLHSLVSLSS